MNAGTLTVTNPAGGLDDVGDRGHDRAGKDPVTPAMPSDERGLTLVEILIALVVISVGLVGIAIVVPVSSEAIQQGGQLSRATFLAEQTLEQARPATWTADARGRLPRRLGGRRSTRADRRGMPRHERLPVSRRAAVGGDPAYRRTLRVADCSVTPCGGVTDAALRLVTVVVTYRTPGAAGQPTMDKAVTLEWLVTRR